MHFLLCKFMFHEIKPVASFLYKVKIVSNTNLPRYNYTLPAYCYRFTIVLSLYYQHFGRNVDLVFIYGLLKNSFSQFDRRA